MSDKNWITREQSPFKTGGDKGKMLLIMVGTFLALFLMLGLGYFFSGRGGGGDEEAVLNTTEAFMRELIKGDVDAASKLCEKDVLKDFQNDYKATTYEVTEVHAAPRSGTVDITVSGLSGRKDCRLTLKLDEGEWKISGFFVRSDSSEEGFFVSE